MPIAKIVKGNTPEGCLGYVLGKPDAVLHETNCVGRTVAELTHEFDLARQAQQQTHRRGRKTAHSVCHTSIAFDWDADLSTAQKLAIAHQYLEGMGFDRTQNAYVVAEHHDTRHQHLHIISSRIRWDGYTTPSWQDYQRAEAIMRQVEQEYGLKPVSNSRNAEVRAPTVAEVRKARMSGQPIPRQVIQQAIEECLQEGRCRSLAQLKQRLEEQHQVTLTTKPVVLQSGAETLALLFRFKGLTYSASKLGKKYSYRRLSAEFEQAVQTQEVEQSQGTALAPTGVGEQGQVLDEGAGVEAAHGLCIADAIVAQEPTQEDVNPDEWQQWLQQEPWQSHDERRVAQEVADQTQQAWALWRALEAETDLWLQQKGIALASESDGQRRLAQVALYCRLKHYNPQQVARALMISPCLVGYHDPQLSVLNWQDRDKERFAVLRLMVKVDQQVLRVQQRQHVVHDTPRTKAASSQR